MYKHLKFVHDTRYRLFTNDWFSFTGHIQIAQVPDRNEPDTVGEIDYKYLFSLLEKCGYNKYIGLEYKPRAGTVEGLKWLNHFGYALWAVHNFFIYIVKFHIFNKICWLIFTSSFYNLINSLCLQ